MARSKLNMPLVIEECPWRGRNERFFKNMVTITREGELSVLDPKDGTVLKTFDKKIQQVYVITRNKIFGRDYDMNGVIADLESGSAELTSKKPELFVDIKVHDEGISGKAVWDIFDGTSEFLMTNFNGEKVFSVSIENGFQLLTYVFDQSTRELILIYTGGEVITFTQAGALKHQCETPITYIFQAHHLEREIILVGKSLVCCYSMESKDLIWTYELKGILFSVCMDATKIIFVTREKLVTLDINAEAENRVTEVPYNLSMLNDLDSRFITSCEGVSQVSLTTTHLLVAYFHGAFSAIDFTTGKIEFFTRLDGMCAFNTPMPVKGNRVYVQNNEPTVPGKYYYYTFQGAGGYIPDA